MPAAAETDLSYNKQLKKLGMKNPGKDSYTCASYMTEVGNTPKEGDVLSWAESSAVVYANSVLGARCNRNSGIIELFGSIAGFVPYFGFLTDEGRKADWVIDLQTTKMPDAQLLGSAVGMKVMEEVPYVKGLDKYLGTELDESATTYLKDFGAATASNGAVGLYHIENLTPEAKKQGTSLIKPNAKTYVITDEVLQEVKDNYPVIWKDPTAKPELCFLGCPHMSLQQMKDWTHTLEEGLKKEGRKQVSIPTVFTASTPVIEEFNKLPEAKTLKKMGVVVSYICPLMCRQLHLPADVYGQPALPDEARHHEFQQAAYLHDRTLLLQRRDRRNAHEGGGLRWQRRIKARRPSGVAPSRPASAPPKRSSPTAGSTRWPACR